MTDITRTLIRFLVPVIIIFFLTLSSSYQSEASRFPPQKINEYNLETERIPFEPNQVIVKMRSGRSVQSLTDLNLTRIVSVKPAPFGYTLLQIEGEVRESCEELSMNPDVESAEPNFSRYCTVIPNDPRYPAQRNLNISSAPAGWDIETGKSNVTVAVIDTGVDYYHPDLHTNLLQGKNFYDNGDYMDDSGHGTAVAGVIGAIGNNSEGIAGAAWNIRILPLKACGGSDLMCNVAHVAQAIQEAIVQDVDIINMSLGGTNSSSIERDAIDAAWNAGIVIFAAVGNESKLGKFGNPELEQYITYPAGYENVCGVSSIDYPTAGDLSKVQLSDFSNSGDAVSVTAVGSRVPTTFPTVDVEFPLTHAKDYVTINGTSFSSPLVSGLAALLKSHFPDMTNREIRQRIESAVWDIGPPGWDDEFGYGLVDFQMALMGGRHASNDVFNLGVATSPVISDDIVIIIKVKQPLLNPPSIHYDLIGDLGPVGSGNVSVTHLAWNSDIYAGRLHTTHQGLIIIKVNGNGISGPAPELIMGYFKI